MFLITHIICGNVYYFSTYIISIYPKL
jgi:hypothetical protein